MSDESSLSVDSNQMVGYVIETSGLVHVAQIIITNYSIISRHCKSRCVFSEKINLFKFPGRKHELYAASSGFYGWQTGFHGKYEHTERGIRAVFPAIYPSQTGLARSAKTAYSAMAGCL